MPAIPSVLKDIIYQALKSVIADCDKFFDVSPFSLSGAIVRDVIYREDLFSIIRSFDLQVIFDQQGFYLAILSGQRVYSRLRLPEVLRRLGTEAIVPPQRALCFAGEKDQSRWRDAQILGKVSSDTCIVRVPSLEPAEFTVPSHRVMPSLPMSKIKQLLHLNGSQTNIEQLLKRLRSGAAEGGADPARDSEELRRQHVAPLFPLPLGATQVHLARSPCAMDRLSSFLITKQFPCVSRSTSTSQEFDHIREGLQSVRFPEARDHPVAIFCTPATRLQVVDLVTSLNTPRDSFGAFCGMPEHFGIRLKPLADGPYVVNDVEQYIDAVRDFVMSPDIQKQSALALVYLPEGDSEHGHPVPLYYRLKALLARTGHPSQMIDRPTLDNKYARWNLALNFAAKLGAIPWTLKDSSSFSPVDLFLGFSYSSIRTERLGQSRNIAYVNIFDASGTWKVFCADGTVFSFEERFRVFPQLALDAVRSATDNPGALRLIEVHYNKRFGKRERHAIADGIRSVSPKASILFVSISDDHPVRFFDASPLVSAPRGTTVLIGDETAYLQTVQADRYSGIPRPLRVHANREYCSLPEDCRSVCERILGLTRLNWRSVADFSSLPVTVLYSSLVAKLTNYFSLSEWKEIDHNLKRTPWFL